MSMPPQHLGEKCGFSLHSNISLLLISRPNTFVCLSVTKQIDNSIKKAKQFDNSCKEIHFLLINGFIFLGV